MPPPDQNLSFQHVSGTLTVFAQGHQVGLNFANETEAEEFLLIVKAVQGWNNNKKMTDSYINLFFFYYYYYYQKHFYPNPNHLLISFCRKDEQNDWIGRSRHGPELN